MRKTLTIDDFPAFPHCGQPMDADYYREHEMCGLTARDYFAANASASDVDRWLGILLENQIPATREEARYAFADAMLHARSK